MCIRRETREKARRSLAFSPVSKPHTHITYMLRQCTSIVYLFPDMLSFLIYFAICWVSWFIFRYVEFLGLFSDMLSFLIYFQICCNRIRTRLERYCVCFIIISLWYLSSCKHLVYLQSDTLFRTSSLASIIGSLVSKPFLMVNISFRRSDWLLLVAI
jgi:hypothetical protein